MQTKGHQQFRITWQVVVIMVLCLAALALPIGGVIVMLQGLTRSQSPPETAETFEALQSRLEGIVDEKLAPESVPAGEARIVLVADDLPAEKARVDALLASFGGISLPRFEGEKEIRLLVQVPPDRLEEFLLEYRGKEVSPAGDASGGFLEIVIRKNGSR